jgi:hypothetical protein
MSNIGAAFALLTIGVVVVLLTAAVVWRVDRHSRPSPGPHTARPFPAPAQTIVLKAIAPATLAALVLGLVGFGRLWAAVCIAVMTGTYGILLPRWLWNHAERRRLRTTER